MRGLYWSWLKADPVYAVVMLSLVAFGVATGVWFLMGLYYAVSLLLTRL